MADAIYHFVWGTFCDWYVELIKGAFDAETKRVAAWAFDQILVMLHPLMPFITEELWNANERPYDLIVAKWPEPETQVDPDAKVEMTQLISFIEGVRSQRLETGFKPIDVIPISITSGTDAQLSLLNRHEAVVRRMARVRPAKITISTNEDGSSWSSELVDQYELVEKPNRTSFVSAQFVIGNLIVIAFTQGFIDLEAEKVRLSKGAIAAEKERDSLAQRLANPAFTERAKPEAVDKARADHDAKSAEAERLRAALERLG
jgi:valyl-tRNA synthetase